MKVKITITRDSVAAGDDADAPHERLIEIAPGRCDTVAFVRMIADGYLPRVKGVGHSWSAFLDDRLVASITVTDIQPKCAEIVLEADNSLHFKYHSATF